MLLIVPGIANFLDAGHNQIGVGLGQQVDRFGADDRVVVFGQVLVDGIRRVRLDDYIERAFQVGWQRYALGTLVIASLNLSRTERKAICSDGSGKCSFNFAVAKIPE